MKSNSEVHTKNRGEMKALEEKIRLLIALQDCDTRAKETQEKRADGPVKIQRLEEGLNIIENQLAEESKQLEAYELEKRQVERDIEDIQGHMEKSTIKLSNIKSNKEYRAALKEIDDLKAEKSLLEDKVLEIMEKTEELQEKCAASKSKRKELKESVEKDREKILKEMKALDHDLQHLKNERARFCGAIDEDLLKRYDFLRQHKGGFAISPVIKGVCQTCHMGIPPQSFNELIRGDDLMACPHCMRIIYWGENENFQKRASEKG
jgi:predicted  nucleic acid-binding Zn-ribbon protein